MAYPIGLKRVALWIGGLTLGAGLAVSALAESVISVDKKSLSYAYRVGVNLTKLGKLANDRCAELGGKQCQALAGCSAAGFGAIALDVATGAAGAVCGQPDEATARDQASIACVGDGGSQRGCKVTGIFEDKTPAFTVPREFFGGYWAASCSSQRAFTFDFVGFHAFQANACSCRLWQNQRCDLWRCGPVKGVYTPAKETNTFVAPTFNKRITKVGDRLVMKGTQGERTSLQRCAYYN